jgi:hypothetical protein
MAPDGTLTLRTFPPEVHQSLAELRQIAKRAKSRTEPGLRWATEAEIALAESLQKPWMCTGHSARTGLPCEKPRLTGLTVCRVHGAGTKQAKVAATRRLHAMVMPLIERQRRLAMQNDNLTVAQKSTSDLLDRASVGAVVEAKVRQSLKDPAAITFEAKTHIGIGFLSAEKAVRDRQHDALEKPYTEYEHQVVWTNMAAYQQFLAERRAKAQEAAQDADNDVIDVTPAFER